MIPVTPRHCGVPHLRTLKDGVHHVSESRRSIAIFDTNLGLILGLFRSGGLFFEAGLSHRAARVNLADAWLAWLATAVLQGRHLLGLQRH